jgi:uncharacterized protein
MRPDKGERDKRKAGAKAPQPVSTTGATVTYAGDRFIHDADTHIVEPPDWLKQYADPAMRDRVPLVWEAADVKSLVAEVGVPGDAETLAVMADIEARHHADDFRAKALENVLLQKQLNAFGAFIPEDRKVALDQLGFRTQLVFNTFTNAALQKAESTGDLELVRAMVDAHNRGIVDYCAVDSRLLPVGYVALSDIERAAEVARSAIDSGCRALIVASAPAPSHGPTHVGLEPFWATAAEARVPVVMHVGGGGEPLSSVFYETGRDRVPEFHGGEGTMRSLEVLALPNAPKKVLSALIVDGVLMRHPDLRIGIHEQAASWVPSFMRELDSVFSAFRRSEQRLQDLDLLPSEYLMRNIRLTPYPYENVGWIVAQSGEGICMFSSDYPHHEGGRTPIERFDAWLADATDTARARFYADNFIDFIGGRVPVSA